MIELVRIAQFSEGPDDPQQGVEHLPDRTTAHRARVGTLASDCDARVGDLGFAVSVENDDTTDSLVDRADQALYAAKEGGRNQLLMWQLGQLRPVASA